MVLEVVEAAVEAVVTVEAEAEAATVVVVVPAVGEAIMTLTTA